MRCACVNGGSVILQPSSSSSTIRFQFQQQQRYLNLVRSHSLSSFSLNVTPHNTEQLQLSSSFSNDAVLLPIQEQEQQQSSPPTPDEDKSTTKLKKKKKDKNDDDNSSNIDNRFKLRNGREVRSFIPFQFSISLTSISFY